MRTEMTPKILLSAAALLAGCATAAPAEAPCSVKVDFGSYCCGVDGETRAAVERYLEGARGVIRSTSQPWGREGESTRCIVTRSPGDTDRIFADLSAMIPPVARRGPVTVTTADGRASPTQRGK
jgi:hypothetical protein